MVDFSDADTAIALLMKAREREGADAAVQLAKQMIESAVAMLVREQGPDEARRFLHSVGAAQRPVS